MEHAPDVSSSAPPAHADPLPYSSWPLCPTWALTPLHGSPLRVYSLYQYSDLPPEVQHNVTSMSYPSFIDPEAPARGDVNFGTIGRDPLLSWVSIGHSPYTDGRRLWTTPMHFN